MRARWAAAIPALLLLARPPSAGALDAALLAGIADSVRSDETSYAWQLDFRHEFAGPFAVSAAWLNEGHFRDHRRDGVAAQLWGRIPVARGRASVTFGAGAYQYFDTRPLPAGAGHANAHGAAPVYSISGSYYADAPWFLRVTANHVHPSRSIDTNTFVVGAGYRLGRASGEKAGGPGRVDGDTSPAGRTELTPFLGVAVRNSLRSRAGAAAGAELRRRFSANFDYTLSLLHEDNPEGIRRTGLGSQIWLVDSYLRGNLALGIGAGLYTFYDRSPPGEVHSAVDFAGLVSLAAGYRFAERWIGRATWSRTMTANDRDTDIFALGVGRRWGD